MQSLYQRFYNSLPIKNEKVRESLYVFTNEEHKLIQTIERKTILISACIGALGVILLYLPLHFWPALFPNQAIHLFGKLYTVPIYFTIYGAVLALAEIVALTFINIYYIHKTGVATGFLNTANKHSQTTQNLVLNIANSKTTKTKAKYGIDPMMGLSRQTIYAVFILQKAKGALSNAFVKALFGRLGGRFTIQLVQNMLGIPVYAFWDAWAARSIMRKTRAVIMGQNLVEDLFTHLPKPTAVTAAFKTLLYDSLQYIATSKRYYHENHNLLTEKVFERYNIDINMLDKSSANFISRLKAAPKADCAVCAKLMLTGWLLDESIYEREKLHINTLHKEGITNYDITTVKHLHQQFMAGKSIMHFIENMDE